MAEQPPEIREKKARRKEKKREKKKGNEQLESSEREQKEGDVAIFIPRDCRGPMGEPEVFSKLRPPFQAFSLPVAHRPAFD